MSNARTEEKTIEETDTYTALTVTSTEPKIVRPLVTLLERLASNPIFLTFRLLF